MFTKYCVKKPYTVIVSVVMVLLLGVISFSSMTTDLLPEMELPIVVVYTTYPGASAEKVEKNVTNHMEESLATTTDLVNMMSVSSDNLSMIILEFSQDTNLDSISIDISGKIDMVSGYFDDMVQDPIIMKMNPNMMPIMMLAVDSNLPRDELTSFVSDVVEPEIKKVAGVASVTTQGLLEEKILISINQEKIDELNDLVLKSVDSSIYDSKKELSSAKSELVTTKNDLQNKTDDLVNQLANTTVQLDSANAQLNAIIASGTTLEANEAVLSGELAAYQKGVQELQTAIDAMNASKFMFGAVPPETLLSDFKLNNPLVEQINALMTQFGLSDSNNVGEMLSAIDATILQLQTSKDELDATLSIRQPEIQAELNNIATLKMANGAMISELNNQKDKLNGVMVELEKAKLTSVGQLNQASAQLEAGMVQIDQGLDQIESARDEAYKSANISSIFTPEMISNILMAENFSMPASKIKLDEYNTQLVKIGEEFSDIAELENLVLFSMDIKGLEEVKLSDVATISIVDNSGEIYAKLNGNDAVILSLQKQSNASTATVCKMVNKTLNELDDEYVDLNSVVLMDQGVYIDVIISSVLTNLLMGGILAIIILYIFLKDVKPTFIIGVSIPISLLFAIVLMYFSGVTLNIISLSGLALGVGMLVDNSIVVIENIYRLRKEGVAIFDATVEGVKSVSGAIFASTLTTICVFLPIVFTTGIARQLFVDMGLTIAYSLVASLIIAVTVVPMMASKLLVNVKESKHSFFDKITTKYVDSLSYLLNKKAAVIIFVLVLLVFSIISAATMPKTFIPEASSSQISLTMKMNKEQYLREELLSMSDSVIEKVLEINEIESIGVMEQTAMGSDVSSLSFFIIVKDNEVNNVDKVKADILENTKDLDCTISVDSSNTSMTMMTGSGIQIITKGNNIDSLYEDANKIKSNIEQVDGVGDIVIEDFDDNYETRIIVDKNKAMEYGLTVAGVYQEVSALLKNETNATKLNFDNKEYATIIVEEDKKDYTIDELQDITLKGTKDQKEVEIALTKIATIEKYPSAKSINHNNQQRTISIDVSVEDNYNLSNVSKDIKKALNTIDMQEGNSYELSGENENILETLFELVKMIGLALIFIYMIMVAQFQSLKSPFIIMFTIPLAFTGGIIALLLTNSDLSIIAMLGFLVLSGIVVNNGIVFIDSVNQFIEGGKSKKDAILMTGKNRLRPILMTAMTTILGLLTMAMGIGEGSEMMAPLAIVTIGGLIYTTFMTLYVVPILFDVFNKKIK